VPGVGHREVVLAEVQPGPEQFRPDVVGDNPGVGAARKRRTVYGARADEVNQKLIRIQDQSNKGIPVPERTAKLAEYLHYWVEEVIEDRRRTTKRDYRSAVRLHIVPVLGKKRLDKLTVADVRHLIAIVRTKCLCCANEWDKHRDTKEQCCSAGKCCKRLPSARSVQFVHSVLRNALNNAIREELISRNVAELVKVPAPKYKRGKGLPVNTVKTILDETKGHRFHIAYVLAATMGLRRGELLGLRWSDLDQADELLKVGQTVQRINGELVVEQDAKSEESENDVPLPAFTVRALKEHRKLQDAERAEMGKLWTDQDLVCPNQLGGPVEPRNFNRHFEGVRKRLGLVDVHPHDLRHSMVTILLELKVPPHIAQRIARHAGMDITMQVYAHANMAEMRKAMNRLGKQFL
jgi:integrase